MAIPQDSIPLNQDNSQQQSSNVPSDSISLNDGTTAGTQSVAVAAPVSNQIQQQPNYTNSMLQVNPLLNPGLAAAAEQAKSGPAIQQSLGTKAGEEVLSAATFIAKDAELGDLMTSAQRLRMENYAQAYRGGVLGGKLESAMGDAMGQHPLSKFLPSPYDPDAIKARSAFESSTNGLLSQGQQVFAGQIGTGNASTRIMSSVLDLLKGEFGGSDDSPASMMGRTQGSQQTIYLIQKFGKQYLNTINQMGITPSNIDNLPSAAIDQIAQGFSNTVKQGMASYELTPEDRKIIQARTDYINEPLQELLPHKNKSAVSVNDVLKGIK